MKNILAFSALLVGSMGLMACGSDDSSYNIVLPDENIEDNATEIRFSKIDTGYNKGLRYSERSDVVLRDGQIQTTSKVFEGVNNGPGFSSSYTYIAPNYYLDLEATDAEFDALIGPTIEILSSTSYSYLLNSSTNSQPLTFTPNLKSYDISEVTTADQDRFFTPLSLYNLDNSSFPANSICYTKEIEKISFPVFKVGSAFLNENTIEEWLINANTANSNEYDYEVVQVGENNEYRAIRLVDPSNYKGEIGYEAAVEMNGSVYSADYISNGYTRYRGPNATYISCDYFNDVAADYLEAQILAAD